MKEEEEHEIGRGAPFSDLINVAKKMQHDRGNGA
jgi:hypothetical protein